MGVKQRFLTFFGFYLIGMREADFVDTRSCPSLDCLLCIHDIMYCKDCNLTYRRAIQHRHRFYRKHSGCYPSLHVRQKPHILVTPYLSNPRYQTRLAHSKPILYKALNFKDRNLTCISQGYRGLSYLTICMLRFQKLVVAIRKCKVAEVFKKRTV